MKVFQKGPMLTLRNTFRPAKSHSKCVARMRALLGGDSRSRAGVMFAGAEAVTGICLW